MTLSGLVRLSIVLSAIVVVVLATRASDHDKENLRKHLGEIQAILDEAQNPCENFPKYACGNFHNASGGESYPNDRVYLSEIANELSRLTDVKLQATRKAKDFLESCQKHQSPKSILKKVEVFKNPAQFKLAKTLGILKTSGVDTILKAHINVLDDKKLRIIISVDENLFLSNLFSEAYIKRSLEMLDVSLSERNEAEKKIHTFLQKGRSILTNSKEIAVIGTDVNALKNFDWNEYLTELKKLPKLTHATIEFVLEDIVNLQKILDLTHDTDHQTLRLVTALEFMAEVIDTACDSVVDYFRMPIFAEFYRLYFTDSDKAFNLDVLKEFENSHSTVQPKVESLNGGVLSRVQERRKIIESLQQLLDPTRIDADYRDIHIEKDNFYQNYLYLAKFKIYKYLSKKSSKDDLAEQFLLNLLNPVNRNKPVFYHFASQSLFLWELFFRENRPKYTYDTLRDCLETQQDKYKLFEFNDLDYFDYVEQFAALKQTHADFRRFWDKEYDSANKLDSTFHEYHLNSDQAFFLNVAQRECAHVSDGKNIPFRIMLNLEDVSKAFNCPAGSQLNIPNKCSVW